MFEEANPVLARRVRKSAMRKADRMSRPVMRTGPRREVEMGADGLPKNLLPIPSMNRASMFGGYGFGSQLGTNNVNNQIAEEETDVQAGLGMGSQGSYDINGAARPQTYRTFGY